jgi:RNA polymerase sigma-70 factor (ECF subfamily)
VPFSDEDLIRQVGEGCREAFDLLHSRYKKSVYAVAARMIQDAEAAEDLTQETFIRVWTKAGSWSGQGPFKGWLYRITSNLCLNFLRSRRRKQAHSFADLTSDHEEEASEAYERYAEGRIPGPETQFERSQVQELVRRLVRELPEEKREVLQLIHEKELSIREASEALGIPDGTIKSRLHYGKKDLEKKIRRYLKEER